MVRMLPSAKEGRPLRLLHLADFHVRQQVTPRLRERIVQLPAILADHLPLDLVFIAGDLTHSGQSDQFDLFDREVIAPLASQLGVLREQIVISPGNHDVARHLIDPISHRGAISLLDDPEQLDELWRQQRPDIFQRLLPYMDYCARSGLRSKSTVVNLRGSPCGIVCLNSSWLAQGDQDHRRLAITRAQVEQSHGELGPAAITLGVVHHPLAWLSDRDARRVRDRLEQFVDVLLTGHVHEDDGRVEMIARGGCAHFAARSFVGDGDIDGFNLIHLNVLNRTGSVAFFKWSARNGSFVADTEAHSDGTWTFSLPDRQALSTQATAARAVTRSSLLEDAESRLERHLPVLSSASGALSVRDRFVEPHLVQLLSGMERPLSLKHLLSDQTNYFLEGGMQVGKTTLLDYLAMEMSLSSVAIRVEFEDIESSLEAVVSNACDISKAKAKRLLEGSITLLVDNASLDLTDPAWDYLRSWANALTRRPRIVAVAQSGALPPPVSRLLPGWKHAILRALPYSRVKTTLGTLCTRTGRPQAPQIDKAILALLDAELPRVPWVLSILVELAANSELGDVTTISRLLRQYADRRLRAAQTSAAPAQLVLLRTVLGYLASALMDERSADIEEDEARELIAGKLEESKVDDNADAVVASLLASRLIYRSQTGRLAFAFVALQELFYAEHLVHERWRGASELRSDDFLQLGGALALFAEMVKAPELLQRSLSILVNATKTLGRPLAVGDFEDLDMSFEDTPDEAVQTARQQVPSESDLDETIERAESNTRGGRQRRLRATTTDDRARSIGAFLTSITILRGSTWLAGSDKKTAVKEVVDQAGILLGSMIRDKQAVAQIVAALVGPGHKRQMTAVVAAILVVIIGSLLASIGGGPHLSITIGELMEEEDDEVRRILLAMWYAEAGGHDVKGRILAVVRRTSSIVALQVIEMWIRTQYVRALTFAHVTVGDVEAILRAVVEERIRRAASKRQPAFEVADLVDRELREAKSERANSQPE
jgi:predicted MPP superfamily phosphohydrolase